jgi:hypothetical protein
MSFYQYYSFKSTGTPLTSVSDFTNASIGVEFLHDDGTIIIKNANGIYNKVGSLVEDDSINLDMLAHGNNNKLFATDGSGVPIEIDGFTESLAINGYQMLPSGLIIQWGTTDLVAGIDKDLTLPTTYPNEIFSTVVTGGSINGNEAEIRISHNSTSIITLKCDIDQSNIYFISLGY